MSRRLRELWKLLRELATDDAYERYLAHQRQAHGGETPIPRREFYLRQQQNKWSGVSRCC